jgi:K+-sensing histidine kinase KdpD
MTGAQTHPPRIVVGVDGSEDPKHALRRAARIATAEGACMNAIAAWEFSGVR